MSAVVGSRVPNFAVSEWVQGAPTNFDQELDHIVLLEVFQVNCPGCFMHAIPEAISVYNKYKDNGVRVLGLATAFEDFDKNTLENLRLLAETGPGNRGDKKRACHVRAAQGRRQDSLQDSVSSGNGQSCKAIRGDQHGEDHAVHLPADSGV